MKTTHVTGYIYRIAQAALTGLLIAVLSGCATLSEGECKTADWHDRAKGQSDDGGGKAGPARE
ncbi:MAG: hypothetical protein L0J73_07815 [Halomonas sp.]|nr:hypothetical protein [Halomonas sp.]